ncbi:hypothetical protein BJN34_24660 [Cupriavidus necator]|uniref:Uncharacterized protein n=1 Tax=Cupriavidus necator TaxID=106590 RepID=A0A1U9UXC9_CUPNE|nr:hypothetical protein [Cupriavidus necator]AQV97057.1 hypothetical protein BJN34_24660 [Cupriavidus necator]
MKRLGFRWVAGLAGAGVAMGVAWALAVDGGPAVAHGSQEDSPAVSMASADSAQDHCNDACVRSRGAAALVVLSQRPPQ